VTGRATFGDFLDLTRRDLDPGSQPDGTAAGDNLEEVIRALARLVTVMRRYTGDLTAAEACVRSDEALATAARFLALRRPVLPQTVTAQPSPLARRLERAAASLRMGRDLLHTHYSADYASRWRPRSEWAHAITSEAVTGALLAELARFARQAADQCSAVAVSPLAKVAGDRRVRRRLNAACQWLWALEASVRATQQRAPTGGAGLELLAAIPVNALPPRPVLRGEEPVVVLCEGATSSAERVRHLAWRAAGRATAPRNLTVASLRQVAENSTVTSHNCASLLDTLAARMAQAGYGEIGEQLADAAQAAKGARGTWLSAARELTRVWTAATPGHVSAAAIEAAELTSWTGRLAYADPQWSLSDGPDRPLRPPETLAAEELPQMTAAVHHACETLAEVASAEHDQIWAAATAGRILVPTRSLPDQYDIPYRFARAPRERVELLLERYADAAQASRQAADRVGKVAEIIRAPSRPLALARSAVTGRPNQVPDVTDVSLRSVEPSGDTSATRVPGPVETTLHDLGVTDPALLARSAEIDRDAERLIIEAAVTADAHRRPAGGLSRSSGTAALVNHALRSDDPRAVALLQPQIGAQRESPEREP
jgi:hypothetical protein